MRKSEKKKYKKRTVTDLLRLIREREREKTESKYCRAFQIQIQMRFIDI